MVLIEALAAIAVLLQGLAARFPERIRIQQIHGGVAFMVESAGKVQQGGCDINVADQRLGFHTPRLDIRITNYHGDP